MECLQGPIHSASFPRGHLPFAQAPAAIDGKHLARYESRRIGQ